MPLGFQSNNHGTIAFGFFNIETDMLLLDKYFIFADEFCNRIVDVTKSKDITHYQKDWTIYRISNSDNIGDLMGAIHGINHNGFIGSLYRKYPFPKRPENFKQKPEGISTQNEVRRLIGNYAEMTTISFMIDPQAQCVTIGEYEFSLAVFHELIHYVWRGGMPRWQDERKPKYVRYMRDKIKQCPHDIFMDLDLR